jgi:hypothetical protein
MSSNKEFNESWAHWAIKNDVIEPGTTSTEVQQMVSNGLAESKTESASPEEPKS